MKLFIYEKFWDSFLRINKTTQVKVTEFIAKFRENSKSAAINLESINTFKDPTLRTARIDQKYRAILKEADPGNLYLLVWVDNHDEAMDWARNKKIDWNENTQSYQIYTLEESVASVPEPPGSEELLFDGKYGKEDLIRLGVPEVLIPSVLPISDLNQLEEIEKFLPVDVFENLFYLLDGASLDALITEVREGMVASDKEADQLLSKNNIRSFIELTDDELFNEALQGSLKKWKYYLHPSQSEFVNRDFKGAVKISGGAGTGKTVVALHRLKYLSNHKRLDKPILFTTFTKELTENLRSLAKDLNVDEKCFLIENIDSLAFRLARNNKLIKDTDRVFGLSSVKQPSEIWETVLEEHLSTFDEDFLQREYEEVILAQAITEKDDYMRASRAGRGKPISRRQRLDIWNLVHQFNLIKSKSSLYYKDEIYQMVTLHLTEREEPEFSHIIVDELQDFSNAELRFLRSLTPEGKNDLFLVGDPLQNIYDRRPTFSKAGINVRGKRSRRLRINYRTTEEIKNQAIKAIKGVDFEDFDGGIEEKHGYVSLFHGVQPEYEVFTNKNSELQYVVEEIDKLTDLGYAHSDIVIAARTKNSVKDFRNFLHSKQIPYVEKDLLNAANEGVRLSTFHGMKGLEFKHVFLVDVNERTLPLKTYGFESFSTDEQNTLIKREKALFYVCCSRAIERLMISGVGRKSEVV